MPHPLLNHRIIGSGPQPVVIVHGLFGCGDNWYSLAHRFGPGFTVVTLDLRNHGGSFHDPDFSFSAMAGDVRALLDSLGIGTADWLGHSLGGKVVIQAALLWPERIRRLVVADIAPRAYPPRLQKLVAGMLAMPLERTFPRKEADALLEPYEPDPEIRRFVLKNLARREDGTGFRWKINLTALRQQAALLWGAPDCEGRRFDRPALFIRGEYSTYVTEADVADIPTWFPAAEFVTLANAGHWVQVDAPEAFMQAVMKFLTTQVPQEGLAQAVSATQANVEH